MFCCWPCDGALAVPTAHGADDDNISGQSNHESNNVRQNNR